jgi:hypothetical protein
VGKQAIAVSDEDDIAWLKCFSRAISNGEDVARSDDRKHAGAVSTQPYLAVPAQDVGDQRGRSRQEAFFTARHAPVTGLVLPHASAIVSNNCSRANPGFS